MRLADAPDYYTAVAAAIAHGFRPRDALKVSFLKWLKDHAEGVEGFKLANFYNGVEQEGRIDAFADYTGLVQFLCIRVHEQQRELDALRAELQATLCPTPPASPLAATSPATLAGTSDSGDGA